MALTSRKFNSLQPFQPHSVSSQVTAEIRRSILSGLLAPGQSLSLRGLAEQLNVSIIPVRDALSVLESEGLVLKPSGRSAIVAPLDLAEFHSIYRVRRLLEPDLARRSCELLSDTELDRLHKMAAAFGGLSRSMDDIYDDHRAFHMALLAPAASSWDERILIMLWRASERYVRIGFGRLDPSPGEHERRRDTHQLLIEKFRERDPNVAAQALDEHLAQNEQLGHHALASVDPSS